MNIPIESVKITIKDNKYYTDVALLVDRDDFLSDLFKLRKKWGLDKDLLEYHPKKLWLSFPWGGTKEQRDKYFKAIAPFEKRMENAALMDILVQQGKFENFMKDYEKARRIWPAEDFYLDIQDIRRKYRRPYQFDKIIGHAVIYGIVRDEDYIPCEMEILWPELEFYQYSKEPELIVKFSPLAKREDIRKLITKEISRYRIEYEKNVLGDILPKVTTKSSIEKHREWYWLNKKQKLGYSAIFKKELDMGNHLEEVTVKKAIERYKKALSLGLN